MSTHAAQQRMTTALADLVEAAKAEGYEYGYRAGTNKAMSLISATDAGRGITAEFKTELLEVLDRIQLAQKMIATYDTRYSVFGEIIRDFAALIGPADAEEGEA